MKKPIIFSVDDDPQVLRSVVADLRSQYKREYRILSTTSANEALESLEQLRKQGENVALFLSDQRMPEMLGVEFLEKAKLMFPNAKRVLLTAYSDIEAAIKAINDVQLDFYLNKPWDPPQEKLYPVVEDLLDEWHSTVVPEFSGLKVVGYQFSPKSHHIKDFLAGNLYPYQWLDIESNPKVAELQEIHGFTNEDLPVVVFDDGSYLADPDIAEIATRIGLNPQAKGEIYDVTIIGAGPAGLAAGVYGGSEGLNTLLIEKRAPGGQAGTSSRIENYLGFPKGLSGAELSRRAVTQATRFGVELLSPQEVDRIEVKESYKIIHLKDGNEVRSRAVVITTGVDYRKLPAKGIDDFTGAGIYYGAATTEAAASQDKDVYVVGGGNSAGQAAMYLSKFAKRVFIVIRKADLTSSMSSYLIDQINDTENIELIGKSQVVEAQGDQSLQHIVLENLDSKEQEKREAGALFIFIGARPYTDWIPEAIQRDERGFIITGVELKGKTDYTKFWKQGRDPYLLESSIPGIFAAGDVRSGAMNRVASAVGEGAMSISMVHGYLAEV